MINEMHFSTVSTIKQSLAILDQTKNLKQTLNKRLHQKAKVGLQLLHRQRRSGFKLVNTVKLQPKTEQKEHS